jgi:3-methyladenine DNA glycosylase AlkC
MAEALKHMYNPAFFEKMCPVMTKALPGFDDKKFLRTIFSKTWPTLELKERVRHIAVALHDFLPSDFPIAAKQLVNLSVALRKEIREQGFATMFIPDYIHVYGVEFPDDSLTALEHITKLVSAEFAVRPFLLNYPEKTLKKMLEWTEHEDANVRRLASEGCRPRLPWGMGMPFLKKDPSPILLILDKLKTDASEYVRRSVANNLNDIAKDHPVVVLRIAKKWKGLSADTDRIIKHACRTMLKKGNSDALSLHGFNPDSRSAISSFTLMKMKVKIGGHLHFNFDFSSKEKKPTWFRLEYAIDYITSTGKASRKVFKILEANLHPGQMMNVTRKQSFKDFTTRKHFKGKHQIAILANGKRIVSREFFVN